MNRRRRVACEALGVLLLMASMTGAESRGPEVVDGVDICSVWSGHPVGFCLLTQGRAQYVAFYDHQRRMTVAQRDIGDRAWEFTRLHSTLGWDSHNYVTMALDREGCLHLSGNMHVAPLVYFRAEQPGDIHSFQRIEKMVGSLERRCTYPRFVAGPDRRLLFTYRDGGSGKGNQIYNVYDPQTKAWRRLLDRPLLDGRGAMNAYPVGPSRGPDGFFHMCWVWRDTFDCSTNHDVSYARSRDLVHWETVAGAPLELPITIDTEGVVVDPVPPGGGAINGNTRVGFDAEKRPIVTYHKFDSQGRTQVYNARYERGVWCICQVSDWDYRWDFQGGGSIRFEIRVGSVCVDSDGVLIQKYSHDKYGSGLWQLDEADLRPVGQKAAPVRWPAKLTRPESDVPGMQVRWASDSGAGDEPGIRYALRWETLGPNRDRPRDTAPPPSTLRLYTLKDR